jgi:hypothetical protein
MIIITGANRSGTSLTTNLLCELGLDLGPRDLLLAGDSSNPRGYFENKEILFTNIRLLLGGWADPTGWADEIEGRTRHPIQSLLMAAAKSRYFITTPTQVGRRAALRDAEMCALAIKYASVAVKDPRFSSTLGAWRERAAVSRLLYCYRHPAEVAMSMKRAYGLPIWAGYYFWNQRVVDFFSQATGVPLVIVNYDNFFSESRRQAEMTRLMSFAECDRSEAFGLELLERVVDPALRHHAAVDTQGIPAYARRQHEQLNQRHLAHATPTVL